MSDLLQAIMNRDNSTEEEANQRITEMVALVEAGDDPEEVLYDEGFEPDYVFDLIERLC